MKLPEMPDGWTIRQLHEEEIRQLRRCPVTGADCVGACVHGCAGSCAVQCLGSCASTCTMNCGGSSSA